MSSAEAKMSDAVLQMVGLATRARRRKVAKLSSKELHGIHEAFEDVREYSQQLRQTIEERKAAAAGRQATAVEEAPVVFVPSAEKRAEVTHAIAEASKDLAQKVVLIEGPGLSGQRVRDAYEIEVKRALADVTSDFARHYGDSGLFPVLVTGAMILYEITRRMRALEPEVLHDFSAASVLEAMEALVKAELVAKQWGATHICAINAGGTLVGQYLAARLGLSKRLITATYNKNGRFALHSGKVPPSSARVLILNDIAADNSLKSAHDKLRETHSKNSYQCMALVAVTKEDYKDLYGYAPRITTHEKVKLPWATDGEFHLHGTTYSLGSPKREIAITKSQAEQLAQEIIKSGT